MPTSKHPTLTREERRRIAEIRQDHEMRLIDREDMERWIDDIWNAARARVGLPPVHTAD